MNSSTNSIGNHVPTIGAAFILVAALIMFGADTSVFSLLVSSIVLLLTALSAYFFAEMRPSALILSMFGIWTVFMIASALAGYTLGAEEHYLMSLSAIAIFWLGQYAGTISRGLEFAWRLLLFIGLIFSVFAFFQHIYSPGSMVG